MFRWAGSGGDAFGWRVVLVSTKPGNNSPVHWRLTPMTLIFILVAVYLVFLCYVAYKLWKMDREEDDDEY